METSRDDFIIAIRSVFIKRGNKQRFSLFGLLFFSIILIVLSKFNFTAINYLKLGINEVVFRTSFIVSLPEKYISYSFRAIEKHIKFYENYNSTKEQLEKLKSKKYNVEFLEGENKRLKKVLEDISYSSNAKIAKVLIDHQSPFLRSIIINKGSKDEIKKGMAVLHGYYLIGKVVEVNYITSRVLLLSDLNSKIPIVIEPSSVHSILSGNGKKSGIIQYTKNNIPLKNGSVLYTSGTGSLFKPGIPIGKINNIEDISNVDFFVDLAQLRFVRILFLKENKN
jgi:rod shape-determining protein MreC